MLDGLFDINAVYDFVHWEAFVFLFEALLLLWIGKIVRDLVTSYDVNAELTSKDNKALATSYVGYMVGQGIIIIGVLAGPATDLMDDVIQVAIWSLLGIILLNIAVWCNDKLLLRHFDNRKEIIDDQNVGTGAVQCGSYIGTAFLVQAVVASEGSVDSWQSDMVGTLVFFVLGQLGFILFGYIYQGMTKYNLHDEIEKDNVAAGVSFGMTLAAIGILMSHTIKTTPSIPVFVFWFFNGVVLLVITRYLVDKLILPGHKLDSEICEDRNWGAALIEGGAAIIVAFLLNAAFV